MMTKLVLLVIISVILLPLAWLWVQRIDYMHKNYPNYKGYDMFNEGEEDDENLDEDEKLDKKN